MRKKYKYSFKHFLKYLITNQIISFKIKTEYKSHLYGDILYSIINSCMIYISGFILSKNFGDVVGWNFIDFITFAFLIIMTNNIGYAFMLNKRLGDRYIKTGYLNLILIKPGNFFLNYIFLYTRASQVFHILLRTIFLIPLVILEQKYTLNSIFQSLIFCLLLSIFVMILLAFLDSFTWYAIETGEILYGFYTYFEDVLTTYPGVFFEEISFNSIFLILPMYTLAVMGVPIFKGEQIITLGILIKIFTLMMIMSLITHINWKYGIKHYQAVS